MRIINSLNGHRVVVVTRRQSLRLHALRRAVFGGWKWPPVEVPTGFETW